MQIKGKFFFTLYIQQLKSLFIHSFIFLRITLTEPAFSLQPERKQVTC